MHFFMVLVNLKTESDDNGSIGLENFEWINIWAQINQYIYFNKLIEINIYIISIYLF